jgi:ribosome biogenesis protein MAK21
VKLSSTDCMLHLDSFTLLFDVARNDAHHFEAALKALAAIWPKVLPPRPLKRFAAQYFATLPDEEDKRRKVVCFWYVEDVLKRTYAQFLAIAESSLKDNLLVRRQCWLDVMGKLLNSVAESRNVVIAMVVGKLGDPNKIIAHQGYHLLLDMLRESSTNQTLLMTEVEKLAFQRNCPAGAQRYCVNVMNQLVFNKNERKLALKAVAGYLALFKQIVVDGAADQNITSALIVGLRRAFPFAGADLSTLEQHLDALFVLANAGPFLQRVSALAMLQQLVGKGWLPAFESRYYRALYAALLVSPHALPHSSQLTVFFTTLYKSMREDGKEERVAAFVHRLLQRCMVNSDPFVCAALLLVAEMVRAFPLVARLLGGRTHNGPSEYSPVAREPLFAKASQECVWVLGLLRRHAHPSVVKLAVLLLLREEVAYDIHPLDDLTIANFLSMFADVEVDANNTASTKGVPVFRRQVRVAALPRVSDRTFVEAAPDQVDSAHLFMHRYAHQRERFLARQAEPNAAVWEQQAGLEAAELQPTEEALFGPVMGSGRQAKAVRAAQKAAAAAAAEEAEENDDDDEDAADAAVMDDEFDEADGLDWGDEEDDEDDDDFDDGDMPDAEGLAEALTGAAGADTTKRARRQEEWIDQRSGAGHKRPAPRAGRPAQSARRQPAHHRR